MVDRGIKIKVSVEDEHGIEGWLYGETSLGIYLSLDQYGKAVRFIPRRAGMGIGYDHDAPKAEFDDGLRTDAAETLTRFEQTSAHRLEECFKRLDYNHIKRIGMRLQNNRRALQVPEAMLGHEFPTAATLDSLAAQSELLDEIQTCGLGAIFTEQGNQLRLFLSRNTLPAMDAEVAFPSEIDDMIKSAREIDHLTDTHLGHDLLLTVTPERLIRVILIPEEHPEPKEREPRNPWATRLRIFSALGKLTLGSVVTAINLGLGALVGVVVALPTLTMGTVGAAVALAGSAYAGLNTSCDALKDLASALE